MRWDKNFLKIVRLLLERRTSFAMYGGIRFGGTMTIDSAFELGFDHVALCAGAGRPTVIPMNNGLAPGVRQASDFLMALQLTGAAKPESIANLTVRLPAVVIGGGLTAIDTATESLAYYPVRSRSFCPAMRPWSPSVARRRCARNGPRQSAKLRPSSSPMAARSELSARPLAAKAARRAWRT